MDLLWTIIGILLLLWVLDLLVGFAGAFGNLILVIVLIVVIYKVFFEGRRL